MANSRISALTSLAQASVVPASDVLPIVNASTTKKITVDALINAQLAQSATTTGIGVTSPVLRFAVEKDGGSGYVASFRSASGNPYITIQTTGGITQIQGINAGFTDVADIGLQPSGGNVKLGGNITQGVAAKGINFTANTPAAGMTSQLLNWYEEGTWTPANDSMTVNSGSWAATGTYTRIGRTVFYSVVQTSGTVSASAGVGMINGFPYAPARPVSCTYSNSAGTLAGVGLLETNSKFYGAVTFASQTALRFSGTYQV
jgi:hypothetical protein